MYASRIVSGLAVVLAGTALLFAGFAVLYNPVFLAVSFVFGASAYFVWYHASGRFAQRVYRGVENQAAVDPEASAGAGPREDWEPPRDGRRERTRAGARARATGQARGRENRSGADRSRRRAEQARQRTRRPNSTSTDVLTAREAYETLGLDPGADLSAVKEAYREKVKQVHPDRPSGDEDQFKRVNAAYERLNGN